jgi:hypothetical protein
MNLKKKEDDDWKDTVEMKSGKRGNAPSIDKYIRTLQRMELLKCELAYSRKKEKVARAELAKLREEAIEQGKDKSDDDALTSQLVMKHSSKVKASSAAYRKTNISTQNKRKNQKSGITKTTRRKSKLEVNETNDSDQTEDSYSVGTEGSVSGGMEETDHTECNEKDLVDSDVVQENVDNVTPPTNQKKLDDEKADLDDKKADLDDEKAELDDEKAELDDEKAELDDKKADKCGGHLNLFNFLFEENPRYCAEGQKFGEAKCMKCESDFKQKETRPNSNRPIYFCPNFEEICDAVLCHGCYLESISTPNSSRQRRSRHQNA